MERQTTFGWLVAADLFLAGTGAGVFLSSFMLDVLNKYEPLARVGAILGPILVLLGTSLLMAELGTKTKFYRLFSNPSSWMTRGTWILTAFIIFSLAYSLPSFGLFAWLPWNKATALGGFIGIVAAIFAVLAATYTGFLLGVLKRIPFWNTPVLPLLFLFSGLQTGMAILLLISPFFAATLGRELPGALRLFVIVEIALSLLQLLMLGAYLEVARHGNRSAAESVGLLKMPLFIAGVVVIGLLVPLGLLFYGAMATDLLSTLAVIAGILLLAGGVLLRYSIVRVGVRLPLYPV